MASPPLALETSLLANSTAISQPHVTLAAPPTTSSLPPPSAPPASPPPLSPPPASPPPTPPAAAASPPPNLSPPPGSSPPPPAASTSPPPSSPPPTPPQPQPSPPPPPNESPPQSPPPSPPIEPPKLPSSPPPFSPPPQSQSSPPPANQESPPTSPPPPASTSTPVTPPPPTGASTTPTPPLPVLFSPPPPNSIPNQPATPQLPGTGTPSYPTPPSSHSAPAQKSPPTNTSAGGSTASSDSSLGIGIIVGVAVGAGVVAVLIAVICVLLLKRKKRQPYYIDTGHPPKAGEPYFNASTNWNSPMEHIIKISPPPGLMATPVGPAAAGVWGTPPPPPPAANSSSEYTSNSCQHQQQHFGPISPGGGTLGGFSKFQFSYEELAAATGGFSQVNLLGQGGFGYVHKGVLPDGKEVAIKSLKDGSGQGEREFQAEVEIISRVHHRHLVSLVGYCIVENQRMLVYEFVPNKTLEFHLHGKGQPVMDWGTRLKIALGSAKGLAYLHEDCHPRIIHRDIKAANILLDDKNEAMVADFGLAKLTSDNLTHVSTRVMGTFGYLAPEYASSGKLTEKSDVFSFGVMLLELITGKRPVDSTNMYMEDSLVDWARPRLAKALEDGDYDELADSRLDGNYVRQEMSQMISCAAACIRHSARRRPKMSQIVRALDGDSSVDLNDGPKPSTNSGSDRSPIPETQTYNTDMYNADMTKFKKMVMSSSSQDFSTNEYGATTQYGLDPNSSSSDEFRYTQQRNKNT